MSTQNGSASSGYTTGGASINSTYPINMTSNPHSSLYSPAPPPLPAPSALASLSALTQQAQQALLATPGPIAPAPSFDTESMLSIKSERLPRNKNNTSGYGSNGPSFIQSSLPRTHSSLSHYNSSHSSNHHSGPQQLVNYGFLGPKMPTNTSTLFSQAQTTASQRQPTSNSPLTPTFYMNSQLANGSTIASQASTTAGVSSIGTLNQTSNQTQSMSPLTGSSANLHANLISGSPHVFFPTTAPNASFANSSVGSATGAPSNQSILFAQQQQQQSSLATPSLHNAMSASPLSLLPPSTSSPSQSSLKSRSTARLDRHVINNNFKNTNNAAFLASAAYPAGPSVQHSQADDNQSFFNDNCTAITGNTSEHSFALDSEYKVKAKSIDGPSKWSGVRLSDCGRQRCGGRSLALRLAIQRFLLRVLLLFAYLTPIAMVILPRLQLIDCAVNVDAGIGSFADGVLITLIVKLALLKIAFLALFAPSNRQRLLLPRYHAYKLALIALTLLLAALFWLLFFVRVAERRFASQRIPYAAVLHFAANYVDCLNVLHVLALVLLELKHRRQRFYVRLLRHPDGASHLITLGELSVQQAAAECLAAYYAHFVPLNRALVRRKTALPTSSTEGRDLPTLKLYDIDKPASDWTRKNLNAEHDVLSSNGNKLAAKCASKRNLIRNPLQEEGNSDLDERLSTTGGSAAGTGSILGISNARRPTISGRTVNMFANRKLHDENELNRKLRKRAARLEVATCAAFQMLKRTDQPNIENGSIPIESPEAASTIFPHFSKTLQKYLKSSRQQLPQLLPGLPQSMSPSQQIVEFLATCLKYDLSPLAFLQRFYSGHSSVFEQRNWHRTVSTLAAAYKDKKGTESSLNNGVYADNQSNSSLSIDPLDDFENWSLICDELSSRMIRHGTEFLLRKDDVSVFVTISNIPNFAITEEVINPNCNKFVVSSETCV